MKEVILIKNGEIALKGLNKGNFEAMLIKNIRRKLSVMGIKWSITKAQSTITVKTDDEFADLEMAQELIQKVFGISAFSRAAEVEKDFEVIKITAVEYLADTLKNAKTFKVNAKRADKKFPMTSPEIAMELGGYLLSKYHHLKVDVKNPEVTVTVEIRDHSAFIHASKIQGAGGMPLGSSGKAMLLISGGIDSPVAGYMMAKRGLELSAIHFVSPPYTSDRALQKVETLCEKMSDYCGKINFYCVPFTEIQENIKNHCPEELFTIIMRRIMMDIAQRVAKENGISCLITGESVAQVASQTVYAMVCTDAVCDIPVFRPVIGMDKDEIVAIAKKIDTFETSILPYDDCCTVFTPKHPRTKPILSFVEKAQQAFDFEPLVQEAIEQTTLKVIENR